MMSSRSNMIRRRASRTRILGVIALLVASGCEAPESAGPTTRPATQPTLAPTYRMIRADGSLAGPVVTHMDLFLVDVPAGAVSGDEQFWRTVDEDAVGVPAGQRLLANGIRCGVAPRSQWKRFGDLFGRELERARRTKVAGVAQQQTVELEVDQPVDHEDVFFLDADRAMEGRTYDRATNGIAMTFGPTPRVPGSVRLSFCPIVKRQERPREYTPLNLPYQTTESDVERIYDVGLTVDVPPDGFFLLAPGPDADPQLTLGGRFLLRREAAARREQVIVAVPSLVPLTPVPEE